MALALRGHAGLSGQRAETPHSQSRPATSPAVCNSGINTIADFSLVNTPREVAIRSRCLMQRSPAGPRRVVLPRELVPVGSRVEHDNSGEACTSKSRCVRATLFVGEGLQTVPVELVSAQRTPKRQVSGRAGAGPPVEKDIRHEAPPLTPELRGDLKQKLDSMVSVCRTDFRAHPRSVRFFLRELWEVCQLLKISLSPRPYRRNLASPLYQFVLNIPNWPPADLAPSTAELAEDSFITLTVMLALDSISWEFKFNQTTYRLCNCRSSFGSHRCLLPTGRLRPSEFATPSSRTLSRSGPRQRRISHAATNDQLSGDPSAATAVGPSRVDLLHKQERHLSTRLLDVSAALRVRFHEFVQQVPIFLEDLLKCTVEKPVAEQLAHQRLLWERWAHLVISEISAFDKSYTQFERLYMTIVEQLMETTLEPLRSMANTCDALLSTTGDPFREIQAASLCQRLGLLKQNVDFGGSNQVIHFDSSLLEKAHRVLQMETYTEVQEMARALLQDFESLCKVLLHLNENQVKPELKENAELTAAIVKLEQVWTDCQFILHQGCLDFIEVLEREVLPQLSAQLRWQIRIALDFSEGRNSDADLTQTDIKAAKVALYQTVPMMVYVEELWRDTNPEESSRKLRFVELCCPQDDRHHTLRRDFGKFDEKRFNEFRTFITDDEQHCSGATRQTDFFRLVYRQLKAVAAFPVQENFAAAMLAASKTQETLKQPGLSDQDIAVLQREQELLEGGARWICLMLKVQAVAPGLFPGKRPPDKPEKERSRHGKGRRMSSATHLTGRRGSHVNAWEALDAVKEG